MTVSPLRSLLTATASFLLLALLLTAVIVSLAVRFRRSAGAFGPYNYFAHMSCWYNLRGLLAGGRDAVVALPTATEAHIFLVVDDGRMARMI
jgi:hypothetical protein